MSNLARLFLLPSLADAGGGGAGPVLPLYWVGDTDADASDATNWSESSGGGDADDIPDANDPVIFNAAGNANCTLAGDVSWGSISSPDGYLSTFDWDTHTITLANGGDATFAASGGTVDCGSGTLTLTNGDFDNSGVGSWVRGTSRIVMQGVGTITSVSGKDLNGLTIAVGATITADSSVLCYGDITISGAIVVAATKTGYCMSTGCTVGSVGSISGAGTFKVQGPPASEGLITSTGSVIDVAVFEIKFPNIASVVSPGTYAPGVFKVSSSSTSNYGLTLSNGSYVFEKDVEFENSSTGTLTIANDTNNPDIDSGGDIIWDNSGGGSIVYNKGAGILTAILGSNQDWDFGGSAIEDVVVDKSAGYLLFSEDCDPDSITQTAGEIRVADGKTLTVSGNCVFNDDLTGVTNPFTLAVTGTNVAHDATITNCTCTGTNLTATDNCVDGGGNTNVDFV